MTLKEEKINAYQDDNLSVRMMAAMIMNRKNDNEIDKMAMKERTLKRVRKVNYDFDNGESSTNVEIEKPDSSKIPDEDKIE